MLKLAIILPFFAFTCISSAQHNPYHSVSDIPAPSGYTRIKATETSFGEWLRNLKLKKERTVYKYDGYPKINQHAQFAVIDMPIGKKDLQQCADAIMRLRAEYFYSRSEFEKISFSDNAKVRYALSEKKDRSAFEKYLEKVYTRCGTLSLEKQLKPRRSLQDISPGDVFIRGGSPGHAMIVVDIAVNRSGKKVFMLAQSYMPAQDIHIVKNPMSQSLSPWYEAVEHLKIITPEWEFSTKELRHW